LPYLPSSRQATPPCSPTLLSTNAAVLSRHTFRILPSLRPNHVHMRHLLRHHQQASATMR
jgi:hypothetical protein